MSLYTTFVFELSRDRFVDYVYNNTTNFQKHNSCCYRGKATSTILYFFQLIGYCGLGTPPTSARMLQLKSIWTSPIPPPEPAPGPAPPKSRRLPFSWCFPVNVPFSFCSEYITTTINTFLCFQSRPKEAHGSVSHTQYQWPLKSTLCESRSLFLSIYQFRLCFDCGALFPIFLFLLFLYVKNLR